MTALISHDRFKENINFVLGAETGEVDENGTKIRNPGVLAILTEADQANRQFLLDLIAQIRSTPDMKLEDVATALEQNVNDVVVPSGGYKRSDITQAITDIGDVVSELSTLEPLLVISPKTSIVKTIAKPSSLVKSGIKPPAGQTPKIVAKPSAVPKAKPKAKPKSKAAETEYNLETIEGALDRMLSSRAFKKEYLVDFISENFGEEVSDLKKMKVDELRQFIRNLNLNHTWIEHINHAYEKALGINQ